MKSFKQLWLSVAKEVLEKTKDGSIPDVLHTGLGVSCFMNVGICKWSGTCARVSYFPADVVYKWLLEKFQKWPKFSGSLLYPVPSPDWRAEDFSYRTANHTVMWSPFHPYGALRRELLQFLIDEMEKEGEAKWRIDT